WMFRQLSLLHLAPSLGIVMPRPPLSFLPRRSTSRSCMLAGWTRRPFPARRRMAGPWVPCMRRPSLGWAACPHVESAIASLIIPPDEALRPNARCPQLQCRVTDDLLCRAYNSGAQMGRIGNSLSHLLLGLSSSLESVPLDQSTQGLLVASLQAFALMTRELGCTLSTLVHAQRQVWLAQSSFTKPCRRTLKVLPVVPGELFGSATLEALERTA
ncbi:hypothetical protein GOODEAATRI_023766, partial [Goodea atripinnis]